ncbi:MAG: T9SS type A sorting domain-containing protein [Bacteroidales bacterium]|nr:T9SS type A sorting domain-containing protein [Bacteroidales bacterium]
MKTIYKHLLITFLFLGNVCFLQAQTTGNFTTLQNLISATAANGTLTLTMDYEANPGESRLDITKNITIDLNGHIVNRNLQESQTNGNVFYVNANVTLTIKDSRPTATHSPAVTFTNPITQVEESIVGGIIMGGNTTADGGGIMVTEGGRLTMNGGSIAKNRSIRAGGGVFNSRNSTFTMTGGAIVGNMAGSYDDIAPGNGYGGGVCNGETSNSSLAQFTMTGGIIAGNTAKLYGGGVYNNHKARFVMRNSKISENEANSKSNSFNIGGGIYNYAYLEIDHSIITGNRALSSTNPNTNTYGGGIYGKKPTGSDSLVMIITHSEISGNQARYSGGGISITAGNQSRIKLVGNTIQENIIYVSGGGLELTNEGTSRLILKDNLFIGNVATTWGGGFWLQGGNRGMTIEMGNNIIRNNTANHSAGLHLSNTTLELNSDSIINNTASFYGGGVGVGNMATFIMKEGLVISGNTARQAGGVYLGRMGNGFVQYAIAELDGALITDNTATEYGGGIHIHGNSTFTMKSGSISGNTANNGGGVSIGTSDNVNYNSTMTMTGGSIDHNSAGSFGGGVYNCSALNVSGGTISDNHANNCGGGVYNSNNGTFTMENGTISNNNTTNNRTPNGGGGVCNNNNFTCTGGAISNNASAADGGGVYSPGPAVIQNATIESNTARNYGGGVYSGDALQIVNTAITQNTSNVWGGGIYNTKLLSIDNSIISENNARSGGGIHYVERTIAVMNNTTISKNHASEQGGGIYGFTNFNGTGDISCTMNGGSITENTAGTNGGGVFFGRNIDNESTFTMNNAIISENTASTNGGGIYSFQGTLVMHNSSIINNNARNGGGVYNYGSEYNSTVTMDEESNKIQDNQAGNSGGGLYNDGNRAIFTLSKGQITGNTAANGLGIYQNGIFNLSGTPMLDAVDNEIYLHSTKTNDNGSGVNRVITKAGDINLPAGYLHIVLGNALTNLYHGRNILETGGGTVVESDRALFTIDNFDQCKSKFLWDRYLANDPTTSAPVVELFSPTWVGIVTQQPAGFILNNIDSKEDLAWLISYVNGYNGQTPHPNATAVLTADVDMGDYEWVPIGTGSRPFSGTFNGQGNTISNLRNTTEYVNPGMFGKVSGTVTNTFVASSSFVTRPDEEGYYGIIADTLTNSGKVVYSEACGTLTASASNAHIGGIVGLVSGMNSTMHSCTSIADLTGYEMGGLACRNEGSVANCLSYPKFTYSRLTGDFVGGLVADNSGSVSNCYLRRDRGNSVSGASYNPLVANGTDAADSYEPSDYSGTQRLNGKYKYGQQDQMAGDQCLLDKLNGKVVGNHARWTRTMASTINNDYPVLALPDFTCIAQIDTVNKLFMEYKADLNAMIRKYNATTEGTNVCLYGANGSAIDTDNSDQVKVYVCENVGLLQAEGNRLNATVGVTFDNSDASDLGGKPYDWHMFATPLQNAPMGISYADNIAHGYMQEPTAITLQANGYFPTDSPYGSMDFYCYSEQYYHWINFKRNSADHWHQDGAHDNIPYTNETTMVPGKGYMMAIDQQTTLMNKGTLTNGDFSYPLSYTELSGDEAPLRGCNLIGNPYQSYLDFDELANDDVDTYYILDADHRGYIAYTKGATGSENAAPRYIHPHQGFFVRATANGQSVTFTNAMRQATGKPESYFRDDEIRYPLVNLVCTDANGKCDYATVEFDRPESGGGEKVKGLRSGNASIGIHLANKNYQIAFAPSGIQTVPVHFKAYENGNYTLSWSTENADFGYLHLIDNLTGIDLDCLQTGEYRFAASETDYLSRFKLVFQYTGMDEHETEPESFAFLFGDEIVVNGDGRVELFDLNGRLVMAETVFGPQGSIGKPNLASGMYLLRLTSNKKTHVQKLIIR